MKLPGEWSARVQIDELSFDRKHNTINGQKLSFGDMNQIEAINRIIPMLQGKAQIEELEWTYRSYNYLGSKYYHVTRKEADTLVAYAKCIVCGRLNKIVLPYDPRLHYDSIIRTREFDIECHVCDSEYHVDDQGYTVLKEPII